jgi:hypothetical protein
MPAAVDMFPIGGLFADTGGNLLVTSQASFLYDINPGLFLFVFTIDYFEDGVIHILVGEK